MIENARPSNQSFFCKKINQIHFSMTKGVSQCRNSADSLAENTSNASKHFCPICMLKPKSFRVLKKSSLGVRSHGLLNKDVHAVVRGFLHINFTCCSTFLVTRLEYKGGETITNLSRDSSCALIGSSGGELDQSRQSISVKSFPPLPLSLSQASQ